MRRFGWQIGGLGVAVGALVGLGGLAFGCGANPSAPVGRHVPAASARATPTPTADPRVAQVEAAARRYIEAVELSAKTGDPSPVDALVVPGSQAEGNAGIASSFSHDNHYTFVASRIDYGAITVNVEVSTATAAISYRLFGHAADWPALKPREPDHETDQFHLDLELELQGQAWLISRSS